MSNLDDVKTLLDITNTDRDKLLSLILKNTESSLKIKINLESNKVIPDELNYIVTEVAVARFNRIENEGMKQYSQSSQGITFYDSDFDPYLADIELWRKNNDAKLNSLGSVQFINGYGGQP
ncbi:phage head-tail connector protein [Lactobacillus sp. CC-MHH1034]|uniref:phage head-tail connector protein n=1 Tax=Agrilactobacillus fermenti TaxID=2586909 RepID=UPI001E5FDD42|nr:phage head-tail connector protein [Agrilactobacillus fermenti]MCD2255772.1 phage head-tail connector protein [Agrilactobacillus fermenti]